MFLLLVALLGLAQLPPLQKHDPSKVDMVIYGPGSSSCGAWTKAAHATLRDSLYPDRLALAGWLDGFLSGVSFAHTLTAKDDAAELILRLKPTDAPAIGFWMDQFCAAHPLETLHNAAQELVVALNSAPR